MQKECTTTHISRTHSTKSALWRVVTFDHVSSLPHGKQKSTVSSFLKNNTHPLVSTVGCLTQKHTHKQTSFTAIKVKVFYHWKDGVVLKLGCLCRREILIFLQLVVHDQREERKQVGVLLLAQKVIKPTTTRIQCTAMDSWTILDLASVWWLALVTA